MGSIRNLSSTNLYAVTNFIRNSAQPKENTTYNKWISRGFGKIGVIQHGSPISEAFDKILNDVNLTFFHAIVRIVSEINPGCNQGTLLLHLISPLNKADFSLLNDTAFTTVIDDGLITLRLNDPNLEQSLLWSVNSEVRSGLISTFDANTVVANVFPHVLSKSETDSDLKDSVTQSDNLISYLS